MQNQEEIISQLGQQLNQLLQSPASYMRQISRFSQKVVSLDIKYIFYIVNQVHKIMQDNNQPIKKKFFAFRFVKDTTLLASHSFYIFTVIKILPIIVDIFKNGSDKSDNGLEYFIKKLGPKSQISNSIQVKTTSTTFLQLIYQFLKWTGTNIKNHPYYKICYLSEFRLYLQCFDKAKAMKITDLKFFTTNDIQVYEHNYLQNELVIQEWTQKQHQFINLIINNWISLPEDQPDKKMSLQLLQQIIQTGDSIYIRYIISQIKPLIQSPITGFQSIQLIHQLLKIQQLQFSTLVRDQLIEYVGYYTLMMSKQKFSQVQKINLIQILKKVFVWKIYAIRLGMKTQSFDQFFKKMKSQWIVANQSEYVTNLQPIQQQFEKHNHVLNIYQVVNKQKRSSLNLREDSILIQKIKNLKYIKRDQTSRQDLFFKNKKNQSSIRSKQNNRSNNYAAGLGYEDQKILPPIQQINMIQPFPDNTNKQNLNDSRSPIKRLDFNTINSPNQEYIKFNNSLSVKNLQQSKSDIYSYPKSPKINKIANAHNIYTTRQNDNYQNNNKKSSILSHRSSNKSRSNKSSSKKSLEKYQKISSLGLQKAKSSKLINLRMDDQNQFPNEQKSQNIKNQQKLNIIKFDDSAMTSPKKVSSSKFMRFIDSDNNPYRQDRQNSQFQPNLKNEPFSVSQATNRSKQSLKSQQIIVEQTVRKPKFAFTQINQDDQLTQLPQIKTQHIKKKSTADLFPSINQTLSSIKGSPSLVSDDKLSKYSSIPSNFQIALKHKNIKNNKKIGQQNQQLSQDIDQLGIRFNKYPNKLKQLQKQIQKTKQYQLLYQQKMKQKNQEYEKVLKQLPPSHQPIYEQNKKLKSKLEQKQKQEYQKLLLKQQRLLQRHQRQKSPIVTNHYDNKSPLKHLKIQQIPFPSNKIYDIGPLKPFQSSFIKQLVSNKCLLQKNQVFEFGYAFKKQQNPISTTSAIKSAKEKVYLICFYFKFKVKCEKFSFKLTRQSLIMQQDFQATVVNLVANKQLKFQQKIIGLQLSNQGQFKIPSISIQIKPEKGVLQYLNKDLDKQHRIKQSYNIKLPCSLFNFIDFHTPTKRIQKIISRYAIKEKYATQQLVSSLKGQYLINTFKCGTLNSSSSQHYLPSNQSLQSPSVKNLHNYNQNPGFYISFYSYIKDLNSPRFENQRKQKNRNKIVFSQLKSLQKLQINLVIKKINGIMFYIESDNDFYEDKTILKEIVKTLSR